MNQRTSLYQKLVDNQSKEKDQEADNSFAQQVSLYKMKRDISSKMIRKFSKGCLSFDQSEMEDEFRGLGTKTRLEGMQIPEGLTIMGEARHQNKWDKLSTSQLGSMMEEFNLLGTGSGKRMSKGQKQGLPELRPSESGNLQRNEMEIIYENRRNMGIGKPEMGDGLSEIGSVMDWGSPPANGQNYKYKTKANHGRTKSSNMLEEGKKAILKHQMTIGGVPVFNQKLERMKRCESGLDAQRPSKPHWTREMHFKSPDIMDKRTSFNAESVSQMMNKNRDLKLHISGAHSHLGSETTPFKSQVSV